jgi:hypothetical protein
MQLIEEEMHKKLLMRCYILFSRLIIDT